MIVKDMFVKPIDRDIKGVVKVGQEDEATIKQDLEEYVVTDELQKHFRDFFNAYKKGINGNTDKVGVWISGFFGSGKSHLLKILSYLLSNKKVNGKSAIEYFIEDNKINDPMVLADMKLASQISTDSILFNIDSKSESSGKKDEDAIVNVFLKVFNKMIGFCSKYPHAADLERQLYKQGDYEKFQTKYLEITKEEWSKTTYKFNFKKGKVKQALIESGIMDEVSADEWIKSTTKPYHISIGEFAELVNDYIETKGNNHHIVFFVDEVGQYIGENNNLMLNVQTVAEDLGRICNGKAWVVVTSQQAIDSITEVKSDNFSKIQGRFDTRINLTSTDVSEVIKKRILDKTETAKMTLETVYENEESVIRNLLVFNDGIEKKLYEGKEDFSNAYPFIPYQFNLLSSVLTSIREHGASGKHLAEGERSMLAMFKESAERLKDRKDGILVSFDKFYDPLQQFLDHNHAIVISKAYKNNIINSNHGEDCFNVNVLKTLFMIKYVKEIKANVDNITTLMVSEIHDDRFVLREKVLEALEVLKTQTLIQKNGDEYIFLTNEEQEVERLIERHDVESPEITKKIASEIFDSIYAEKKYRYPEHGNRYTFNFNEEVDEYGYGKQIYDIGVSIITPMSEYCGQDKTLRMMSSVENDVYVSLPDNDLFIKEIKQALRIEKFLSSSEARNLPRGQEITAIKSREMGEYRGRAERALREALKNAEYYVKGDKLNNSTKEFKSALTLALGKVVSLVYSKLYYINSPKDDVDTRNLFKQKQSNQLTMEEASGENENAIRDLLEYIKLKTRNHTKISMKDVKDKFKKPPYGFLDIDIEWLIAKCFTDGKLEFTINGNNVSLINETSEKIIDYITKKTYSEKLLLSPKEIINPKYVKIMKNISKELFKRELTMEDTDAMVVQFNKSSYNFKTTINDILVEYRINKYPGKRILELGKNLFEKTLSMKSANEVFEYVFKNQDDYEDFAEDFCPVKSFFEGNQKKIWESSINLINIYTDSKNYFVNAELEELISKIDKILSMASPYDKIKDLPELCEKFRNLYNNILDKELQPVSKQIEIVHTRVISRLDETDFADEFKHKYNKAFINLKDKAECCNNIKDVNGFKLEADSLKKRFLTEIDKEVEKRLPKIPINGGDDTMDPVIPPVVKKKTLYVSDVYNNSSWQIKNEKDLEEYLNKMRKRIKEELKNDVIINIEF